MKNTELCSGRGGKDRREEGAGGGGGRVIWDIDGREFGSRNEMAG